MSVKSYDNLLVGVDLGTSAIKIINPLNEEKVRILSCVGELPESKSFVSLGLRRGTLSNLAYYSADRSFLLGDGAQTHSPAPRWFMYRGFASQEDLDYAVDAIKASIAALTPFERKREHIDVKLLVGVPAVFDPKYEREIQTKLLKEEHHFTLENYMTGQRKQVSLSVNDLRIVAQSLGTLVSHCIRNKDESYSGTVLDVGFGLTNVCAIEDLGVLRYASATVPRAVGDIALHIRESLLRRGGGADIPGVFALGELLKEDEPTLQSRSLGTVNLKEEREKASLFVGQELWREAGFYIDKVLWRAAGSKLLITGGGGSENFVGRYLKSAYSRLNPSLGDIFNNADGLMFVAKDIWGEAARKAEG